MQASAGLPADQGSPPAGLLSEAIPGVGWGLGRGPHPAAGRCIELVTLWAPCSCRHPLHTGRGRLWEGGPGKGASALLPSPPRRLVPEHADGVISRCACVPEWWHQSHAKVTGNGAQMPGATKAGSCRCRAQLGARAQPRQEVGREAGRRGLQLCRCGPGRDSCAWRCAGRQL